MILDNFFKPRWQHADAQVRRQALDGLDDLEALGQIARQDPEPELRMRALERLADPSVMDLAARTDTDPNVRNYAATRLRALLTGADPDAPPLDKRLEWVNQIEDSELLAYLARHGGEATLRSTVLERIDDDEILAASVVTDPDARVRSLAAGRLRSRTILERVAKLVRNRDKGVHRIVQDRLTTLRDAEQLPQRHRAVRREICADAEALVKRGQWHDAVTPLERIEDRWANAEGKPDTDLANRFTTAVAKIRAGIAEYHQRTQPADNFATVRATKESLCFNIEKLVADLSQRAHLEDSDATMAYSVIRTLENSWNECAALPETEEASFRNRFYEAQHQVGVYLGALLERAEHRTVLREFTDRITRSLAEQKSINEEKLNQWQQEFQALGINAEDPQEQVIAQRFHDAIEQFREKTHKAQEKITQNRANAEAALNALEEAVEGGILKIAAPALVTAQTAIGELPPNVQAEFKARLEKCATEVHKLQEWQRWANHQERERLCQEVESLIGSQDPPEKIANRIKALRDAWNILNPNKRTEGGLNGRFNSGCAAAFEPCRIYFAEQARRREAANASREQLITQVEEFIHTAGDWSATDWKSAEKFLQEIRTAWHDTGPIDRRAAGRLQERFDTALEPLRKALRQEQRRNLKLKEELVTRAEAVQKDLTDPRAAVNEIKILQNSWKNLGSAPRRQEQVLWKRMRVAADAVFERRQAQVQAQEAERNAARAARASICEQIEALAHRTGKELINAASELANLEQQWANLPQENSQSLENRLRKAVAGYHAAIAAQRRREAWSDVETLINQANLCAELESQQEQGADLSETLPAIQERWDVLAAATPPPPGIAQRFEHAVKRLPPRRIFSADLRAEIERLCVRLEVLAGIDSPPEAARTRLALQVDRLTQGFAQRREAQPTPPNPEQRKSQFLELLNAWYAFGLLPPELRNSLEARLQRVLNTIKNSDY